MIVLVLLHIHDRTRPWIGQSHGDTSGDPRQGPNATLRLLPPAPCPPLPVENVVALRTPHPVLLVHAHLHGGSLREALDDETSIVQVAAISDGVPLWVHLLVAYQRLIAHGDNRVHLLNGLREAAVRLHLQLEHAATHSVHGQAHIHEVRHELAQLRLCLCHATLDADRGDHSPMRSPAATSDKNQSSLNYREG